MTAVIKCNTCNIVIDEMLSYIQNKVSVMDEETLVRICKSSFQSDEIKKSKSLLFDSLSNQRKILRKNKGREERDLADIINLFKSAEPDEIPVFVARQLERLPPVTFDHLDCTKLLKDIVRMQTTIDDMKSSYATLDNLKELKAEFIQNKNSSYIPSSAFHVNKNRSALLMNSGPIGLSDMHDSFLNESFCSNHNDNEINKNTPQYRNINISRVDLYQSRNDTSTQRSSTNNATGSQPDSAHAHAPVPIMSHPITSKDARDNIPVERTNVLHVNKSNVGVHDDGECEGWQQVTYRRKRPNYRFLGKSGVANDRECNFKAAEKKVSVFITNIHNDTTEEDVIRYIYNKTKESVSLEKIFMKKQKGHKAFRFYVSESKLPMYLDENLWPQGIVFRRFVSFNSKNSNRHPSSDGPNAHING